MESENQTLKDDNYNLTSKVSNLEKENGQLKLMISNFKSENKFSLSTDIDGEDKANSNSSSFSRK